MANMRNFDTRHPLVSSRCIEMSTRRISDVYVSMANSKDSLPISPERSARNLQEYVIEVREASTDRTKMLQE